MDHAGRWSESVAGNPARVGRDTLRTRLAARWVHLSDEAFWHPHLNGFRVGYALLSPETMQRGIAILAEELQRALA